MLPGYDGPHFYIVDQEATPLARIAGTDRIGAAIRRFPQWKSVYLSRLGSLNPRLLRNLAAEAGLTPTGPEDDVTYAGNGLLVIHALTPGDKTLRWQGPRDVFDLQQIGLLGCGLGASCPRKGPGQGTAAPQTRWPNCRRAPFG